ncbi:hypothetical protein PG995_003903 [Apiospora arundinis]
MLIADTAANGHCWFARTIRSILCQANSSCRENAILSLDPTQLSGSYARYFNDLLVVVSQSSINPRSSTLLLSANLLGYLPLPTQNNKNNSSITNPVGGPQSLPAYLPSAVAKPAAQELYATNTTRQVYIHSIHSLKMIDPRSMESLYEHFSAQEQHQPIMHHQNAFEHSAALEEKNNSKPSPVSGGETHRPAATRSHRSFWFFWRADVSR